MSDILNTLFDPYDRKARLGPALLCGLPFVVSIVLLVPDLGAALGYRRRDPSIRRGGDIPGSNRPGSGEGPGTGVV